MASRQRSRPPKKQRAPNPLADLGIFDIPNLDMDVDDDGGDDSDVDESALESELELILSGKASNRPARPKKKVVEPVDIERIASECMKDLDEDEDENDDSVLTDVTLLKELQSLSFDSPEEDGERPEKDNTHESVSPTEEARPPSEPTPKVSGNIVVLLEERLKLYNEAVAAAKAIGDSSKARRYGRAVKTLEGLVKTAKSGRVINEEDIPPVVNIPKKSPRPPPPPPAECIDVSGNVPVAPSSDAPTGDLIDISFSDTTPEPACEKPVIEDETTDASKMLTLRRNQYKVAALQAKRAGDKATALKYMKMAKTFDSVLEALKNGEPVDMSSIPPAPDAYVETVAPSATDPPQKELQETQTSSIEAAALSAASEPADPALFEAPPAPTSVLEALQQRLEKYTSTKAAAETEGNSSKVRRLQRIIKSYEKAIKDFKAGKPVDFEELPTPPGFAPIPIPSQTNASLPSQPSSKPAPAVPVEKPKPEVKPPAPKRPAPQVPKPTEQQKPKLQRTNTSTYEKQLEFLLERQRLFREAAISAKKNGDLEQAKQYLAMSKGFNSMIEASKSGLPIDASSIPTPPQLESDFVVVDISECIENEGSELIETLENDLKQQIEVCTRNKEHFLRLGDVSSASKFEKLGLESRKDLSVIHHLKKTGSSAPKFHYETRLFSMVQCHTDLGDNDFEVTVERGINLPGKPDDLDSYVRVDFPIPSDAPQRAKTQTIRDTNNPIFQDEFKFEFNRKSRAQLRQFKRGALKLEVWSKGCYSLCCSGFLRSDTLLGTAHVKLVDLESKCVIHDCFDLMDGRKACGGKLEVKVRIRDPLFAKQVEQVREKWLVIGS